ncbi:exocyst complex component EXO70H1-like [Wolffia australiana]
MARGGSSHGRTERTTPLTSASASPTRRFGTALMEENISVAEEILAHWEQTGSSSSTSESLHRLLEAIGNLHRARKFFFKDSNKDSSLLVRSQALMDKASKRLQLEFHRILSSQRDILASDSLISQSSSCSSLTDLDTEDYPPPLPSPSSSSWQPENAISDLRFIARCMVYCGHGKECINVYRLLRRSVVEEGLYNLGFDRLSPGKLQKLPWNALEDKIWSWVGAAKTAVHAIFAGERALCRQTFSSSSLRDTLFSEITGEAAARFFAFPELLLSKIKLSPEKTFRVLDMYETILELLPEIESVFSHESTSNVRAQVEASLTKLAEAVRLLLEELESAIKKDNTKAIIPGGGLHPLARYVANFVSLLADYSDAMADIFFEQPAEIPPGSPLHNAAFLSAPPSPKREEEREEEEEEDNPLAGVSLRLGSLIFVLLCKLDSKASLYGDPALGYLFLANNLQYLVRKIQRGKLADVLGEDWVKTNAARARRYAASYERLAWNDVMGTISGDGAAIEELEMGTAVERMKRFNEAFDEACKRQAEWVITDRTMEHDVKLSLSRTLMSAYRPLYVKCRSEVRSSRAIRFAPEDLANHVSDLFCEGRGSSVYSGHGSSSGPAPRRLS